MPPKKKEKAEPKPKPKAKVEPAKAEPAKAAVPKVSVAKKTELRMLGEGSFGCVVSHPLECSAKEKVISSNKDKHQQEVAKLFYEEDKYKTELDLGKLVKKIDPTEENILVPIRGCMVSRNTLYKPNNINAVSKCENLASMTSTKNISKSRLYQSKLSLQNVWQLVMPYAGKEIDMVMKRYKNPVSTHSFARMILPLFEALVQMKEKRIVHQDIKTANVLMHDKKAILIDYSLMMPFTDVYKDNNYNRLKRRYRPYPPEYYMASIMIKHKDDFKGMKSTDIKASIIERYKNHLENIQHYFYPYYTMAELLEASNYGSLMLIAMANYKKFTDFADRIDIFSVGTLITEIDDYIATPFLDTAYVTLMKGILHPDPRQRMSPEDALELCKKIAEE